MVRKHQPYRGVGREPRTGGARGGEREKTRGGQGLAMVNTHTHSPFFSMKDRQKNGSCDKTGPYLNTFLPRAFFFNPQDNRADP